MAVTAYLFAIAVGFVAAGLVGSAWELAFDEEPHPSALLDANPTLLTPLRVMAIVLSGPVQLAKEGFWWLLQQPVFGAGLLLLGSLWSFFLGVVILTRIFGFN